MKTLDKDIIKIVGHDISKISMIESDALITKEKNFALTVYPADCIVMAAFDPVNEVLGIAHLSWKSTDKKLAKKLVSKMVEDFSSNPGDLIVGFSPGIKKESYIFKNPAQESIPEWNPYLEKISDNKTSIDLFSFNKDQVIESGVNKGNIDISNVDTAKDERFFSHYRAVRSEENEGRGMCVASLV